MENWIALMKEDPNKTLKQIYVDYRPSFVNWMKSQYQYPEDKAEDFFQEVLIVFYQKIRNAELSQLTCELKTYLYGIGKILVLRDKDQKKLIPLEQQKLEIIYNNFQGVSPDGQALNSRSQKVLELIRNMKDPCQEILYLFYYKRLSLSQIAREMEYKGAEVVKVTKHRCMKRFMSLLKATV